eukprot:gene14832-biopygen23857
MLYKKGDPTQANHYRPIGLNNTMGELWTNMVTTVMSKYLDQYQVLSDSQEGFRQNRSTHRQLTHLLHDIEDAAHSKRDLFAAYFDFSSAFNMVDHDKLLQTMYDLGIPVDVIETVKGIYNGATTHMYLNNTQGKPIQITRGTIQGDTLSPLLFIIFIEPLLRWLQAGGRGYTQGITSTSNTDQDKTGSLGYADDTSVVTNTADNLKVQCLKVQQFSTWSGIPLNGGTFAGDVATLLSQHKDTTISNVSPAIHKAMSTLGMTTDLDTSPLLMSPHLPMGNTPTPIGQLFGLGPHCYTQPWYGGNTHLTSQNPEEAHKAVRWALGSAIHAHTLDIPACTILLVPDKPTYAHNALLNHPWVMELATLPPKAKPLTPSLIWTGGKLNPAKRHRGTYKLIAISNPAGHAKYLHNPPTTWAQTMRDMGATSIPRPGPPPSQLGLPTTHLPKALSSLLKTWAQQPTPMQIDPTPITPPVLPCTHAILQAPGLALYTDGSAIIDKDGVLRLGAGVYSPRAAARCLRIDPGGQGITADINRAELVAIQQALIHSEIDEELTIYSDSLCSLQLINLHIYHPSRTRENKHRDLLQDIAIHIINKQNAAATTRLLKVRSHSGIIGNDEADTLAKEATTGYNVIGPVKTGEHAHLNMHWPSVQPPKSINGDQPPRHPANNLTKGIKANLPTPLHTGHANTTGIYASMWEQANPFLLPQASNRFWQSTDMKWWQKVQIHKARWGRLWTRKLAYRYKRPYGTSTSPPSDDNCPLCRKAQDGAGHILAGCSHPVFKGMYINRHNKAVQIIQKAVAKGALGALPMYMDAGTCEATSDIPTRPPATLNPPDLPQATWDKYRPDLLLIDDESKPRKAYLVELGYCSDTNHQIKFQEKSVQHKELQRILQQQGFLVHYLVFIIGTTGTIPIPIITNLSTLGISREHVDKLISKLHRESTASCTSILATRRMKESLPPGG